jgi:hypothetical protein
MVGMRYGARVKIVEPDGVRTDVKSCYPGNESVILISYSSIDLVEKSHGQR